jgi:alpha/beta superfamily hydrolase
VVQPIAVVKLVEKLRTQKQITFHHEEMPRANHFFEKEIEDMMRAVDNYLDFRLDPACTIR